MRQLTVIVFGVIACAEPTTSPPADSSALRFGQPSAVRTPTQSALEVRARLLEDCSGTAVPMDSCIPLGCAWDVERSRLVMQRGGDLNLIDMRTGSIQLAFPLRNIGGE